MSIELTHGMADGTAEEFILAGVHLSKVCIDSRYIAPAMVCFSFAIELHIKAILASCAIDPKREHCNGTVNLAVLLEVVLHFELNCI
nr:hypothetical protein BCU55_05320 [Shewanella sp. 10N.286.48.A6]